LRVARSPLIFGTIRVIFYGPQTGRTIRFEKKMEIVDTWVCETMKRCGGEKEESA